MAGINPLFKNCEICDGIFYKRDRYSYKQWKSRRCCSKKCAAILIGNIKRRPVIDRFMEKIKSVDSGCIEWQGYKNKQGYGYMTSRRGSSPYSSHRLSYELFVGEIPDGMWVLHKCDNPPCVNPKHLFIGTRQDNIDDMVSKNRQQRVSRAGEDSHTAILKQEDVDKIRSLYGTGKYTYQELADIYPVKKCTIESIVRNINWYDKKYIPSKIGHKKPRPYMMLDIKISDILNLRDRGLPLRAIGKILNTSKTTISNRLKEA